MPVSFRTYLAIAVLFGGLTFLLSNFFGDDIANWAVERQYESQSKGLNIFDYVVYQPIEFMMAKDTRLMGAVAAGVAWPLILVLLILVLLSIVILSFVDVNDQFTRPILYLTDVINPCIRI